MEVGAAAVLVTEKLTGVEEPATVAVTVYVPAMVFAENAGDVAMPEEFVVTVAVVLPPIPLGRKERKRPWVRTVLNVPLGPELGAVKVTEAPLTGVPLPSLTVTWKFVEKLVFTVVECEPPPVTEGAQPMS